MLQTLCGPRKFALEIAKNREFATELVVTLLELVERSSWHLDAFARVTL